MAKLVFLNNNIEVNIPDDSTIEETCEKQGVPFACSEGICGSCVIEIIEGMENLNDFTDAELDFFGEKGSERLACQCKIKKGTVKLKF
jgi:ferredoxin